MSVGISEVEFILARNYERNVDTLQATAQGIIDSKEREIIKLRRQLAAANARIAELEAESLDDKMAILTRRRRY